jgi:choline dehydrogenase-like flavoprotein
VPAQCLGVCSLAHIDHDQMISDARTFDSGTEIRGSVCIIGGGVAGIAMAREFERQGIDTVLLESGGFHGDEATSDLYRGENIGLPYTFADNCRTRFLGGSSNCWGGWCAPLQSHDLERRDWVPESGWPYSRAHLQPYYERAHPFLRLGPMNYDVAHWVGAIHRPDVHRIPLPTGRVQEHLAQFSSPMRLGRVYRDELRAARHVRTLLHANVVDIDTAPDSDRVSRVQVKTLTGRRFTVAADHFVLACGGIENARLLLASNKQRPQGLGNEHDLVGRYFTDHPRLTLGDITLAPRWRRNKLYDVKFHYMNRAVSAGGTFVSAQFGLSREVQQQEGLLNSLLWFSSVFTGEGTAAADALIRMKQRYHGKADPSYSLLGDVGRMAADPLSVAAFGAARIFQPRALIKKVQVQIVCEPAPNRDSRVTLSDAVDALGMPRVRVDWRISEQAKRTYDRSLAIFADELRRSGVAEIDLPEPLEGRPWPVTPALPWDNLGTWHHMGTTRMADSPSQGVVDRDGKVHGLGNLYVAGSSVFPTFGANYPTITIVALAFKLADHLSAKTRQSAAAVESAVPARNGPVAKALPQPVA